jgi:Ca2+/Na+ antiporter
MDLYYKMNAIYTNDRIIVLFIIVFALNSVCFGVMFLAKLFFKNMISIESIFQLYEKISQLVIIAFGLYFRPT